MTESSNPAPTAPAAPPDPTTLRRPDHRSGQHPPDQTELAGAGSA